MSSSNSSSRATKASEIALATQLIAGAQKHLANLASFTVASTAYTPAQVTADLQQLVVLLTAVAAARSVVSAKVADEKAEAPTLRSVMAAFVSYVRLTYSGSPDVLADFGIAPTKARTPLTAEQKVVAVAKRASTRKARGTTSKKAKLAIKGNVVSVALVPIEAGPPVGTPSAPTAPATGGGTSASATSHGT